MQARIKAGFVPAFVPKFQIVYLLEEVLELALLLFEGAAALVRAALGS
jgi:hypothetical protein